MKRTMHSRLVAIIFGVLFLIAGYLKAHQVSMIMAVPTGLWSSPLLRLAQVEFEYGLGLWLLSGLFPKMAHRAATGCFAVFSCFLLYKVIRGETTCGCFGAIEFLPAVALVFDILAVGVLLTIRPTAKQSVVVSLPLLRYALAGMLFVCINIPMSLALYRNGAPPLVPSAPLIQLGKLEAGGKREETVWLLNSGNGEVEVERIEASCDCLTVLLDCVHVPPGGRLMAGLLLDLRAKPEFVGNVAIEVRGRTSTGAIAFVLLVTAEVHR